MSNKKIIYNTCKDISNMIKYETQFIKLQFISTVVER